jgi:hypothetical protein
MNIEPKIKHPLTLKMSHHGCEILANENYEQNLPLKPGAMIGPEHYGFTLIVDYKGKQSEKTYGTQFRIQAVGIENDKLSIYEEHKYVPWRFDKHGHFMNEAVFLAESRRDCDFLAKKYGIVSVGEIEKINNYLIKAKTLKRQ